MKDHNSPESVEARVNQSDPIIMYLIVRESLKMSIGKTAAQCAHAAQMMQIKFHHLELDELINSKMYSINWSDESSFKRKEIFQQWLNTSFRKVVLKADEKEWLKVSKLFVNDVTRVTVIDAGLTEIASGSETVICLWPMLKSEAPSIVKRLQVLK